MGHGFQFANCYCGGYMIDELIEITSEQVI
jgi:hypothetical protein